MKPFDKVHVSSPCGLLYYKNVERLTYTYIAYPGFLLAFDDLELALDDGGGFVCLREVGVRGVQFLHDLVERRVPGAPARLATTV